MTTVPSTRRRLAAASVVALSAVALAACDASSLVSSSSSQAPTAPRSGGTDATPGTSDVVAVDRPSVRTNVRRGAAEVPVSTLVKVGTDRGRLTSVAVTSDGGSLPGTIASDGTSWTAAARLEPGTSYTVKAVADDAGVTGRTTSRFTTEALSLDQQTYPSLSPLSGQTVGVGMPVIVSFDVPVTNRKAFERNMHVTTTPQQTGSWHWLSDNVAHWRPKTYWMAGSHVDVAVDVNGVDAGNGIYGQEDRHVSFNVGDAHIYRVNAATHQMKVFSNGRLLRTIPITAGKPGYTTRSGTKVIVEKFDSKEMNSETVGITGPEAYDIGNVQWAMRLTYSGEFIHAAPWSVGSQGYANVSHGCTGMSTSNAAWLYAMSRVGDVAEYTGTDRPMTLDNGYGDWNDSYTQWKAGSALS